MPALKHFGWIAGAGMMLMHPVAASACVACFGPSDDSMAKGAYMGIFTLLAVVTAVLIGIAGVGIFIVRRTARLSQAEAARMDAMPQAANSLSHSTH